MNDQAFELLRQWMKTVDRNFEAGAERMERIETQLQHLTKAHLISRRDKWWGRTLGLAVISGLGWIADRLFHFSGR